MGCQKIIVCVLLVFIGPFAFGQKLPKHIRKNYELVWKDDFKGKQLDTTKWHHRSLGRRHYGIVTPDASFLDGKGHLVIRTSKRDSIYSIGQIGTQNTYLTTYGYFECRAKLNKELGPHTAFWLQSPTVGNTSNNPKKYGTEIDIFEYHINKGTDKVYHNLHWNGYGEAHKSEGVVIKNSKINKGFHTFGLEWTKDEYIFYVDGKETWRTSTAVSQRPEYMILSAELTGWGGDFSKSNFPDDILFDYVKVYKKKAD